jgi:hypothetical protein
MPSECQIFHVSVKNAIRLKVLSSHKRGVVKSGTNEFASTLYTIANFLGTHKGSSSCFKIQKPVTVFRAKEGGVLFAVDCATKNPRGTAHVPILPLPPPQL